MLTASHGFKRNTANPEAGVVTYDNQADNRTSLAGTFQIDAAIRQRILFYMSAAGVGWIMSPGADALARTAVGHRRLPTRSREKNTRLVGYTGAPSTCKLSAAAGLRLVSLPRGEEGTEAEGR